MQGESRQDRELLDAGALCGHLVPAGSVYALLAEHRDVVFPDELFADLFPSGRGRPSVPAGVIATTMVLQTLEGLSDREAARQLATSIMWKAAAGLSLTDEGFHPTVLVLWRNKLRNSDAPERIFDAVRQVVNATGVLAGRTRRALDSTVLDDAVVRQDTVTMIAAQIRRVRKLIPVLGAVWVREHNLERGRPPCDWDDPADVDRLISELVDDANELVWAAGDLDLDEEQAQAVALLALVAGQDVEPAGPPGSGKWAITKGTAADRVISTVDPETRHTHKTSHSYRDGYKAHVAVEPDTGLITATDLSAGNTGDAEAAPALIDDEPPGTEVLGDSAYGSGELRDHLEQNDMTAVIKPPSLKPAVTGGYTLDDFDIDTTGRTVTCPDGHTINLTAKNRAVFGKLCARCPLRRRCTTAQRGRVITLHPHHLNRANPPARNPAPNTSTPLTRLERCSTPIGCLGDGSQAGQPHPHGPAQSPLLSSLLVLGYDTTKEAHGKGTCQVNQSHSRYHMKNRSSSPPVRDLLERQGSRQCRLCAGKRVVRL